MHEIERGRRASVVVMGAVAGDFGSSNKKGGITLSDIETEFCGKVVEFSEVSSGFLLRFADAVPHCCSLSLVVC